MGRYRSAFAAIVTALVLTGCSGGALVDYNNGVIQMLLDKDRYVVHDTLSDEGALQVSADGEDIALCINYTTALTGTPEQTLLDIKDTISEGYTVKNYRVQKGSNGENVCTEALFDMVSKDGQLVHAKEKVLQRGGFDAVTVWYLAYEYVDRGRIEEFDSMYNSIDWSEYIDVAAERIRKKDLSNSIGYGDYETE